MFVRHIAIPLILGMSIILAACSSDGNRFATVKYEMQTVEQRFGGEGDTVNGYVYVNVTYPEIEASSEDGVADSISGRVRTFLLRPMSGGVPFASIDDLAKEYIRDFKEKQSPEWPDGYGWTWLRKARVETDTLGVFGLSLVETRYQGPDHQFADRQYVNIDTRTGRRLQLSDLFVSGYEAALNQAAEQAFRRVRKLDQVQSLGEAGFTFDSTTGFAHNGNFLIRPEGLAFYFNRGEVGPATLGATDFTILYRDLTTMVRLEGPLGPFIVAPQS